MPLLKASKLTIISAMASWAVLLSSAVQVNAAAVVYVDRDDFLAALVSSSTDNFNDLSSGFYGSPVNRSIPGFTYDAAATGGLYPSQVNGSIVLSPNNPVTLTLNFTTGAPTAVGGYFFATDINFNVINRTITFTANPGAAIQSVATNSATNFFGWIDTSGTAFTSLTIEPGAGSPNAYATVDDLILGQARAVPGPLPMMGAAMAFAFSRRLRSRISNAHHRR